MFGDELKLYDSIVIAKAGHTTSHSLQAMHRSSPVQ